jgi:hypothetical protein
MVRIESLPLVQAPHMGYNPTGTRDKLRQENIYVLKGFLKRAPLAIMTIVPLRPEHRT